MKDPRVLDHIDRHLLSPAEDGRTQVTIEESLSGPLLTLFYTSDKLRGGHEAFLHLLKATAER